MGLTRYRETLDELVSVTRRLGAEPVVVILPAPIDLDPEPTPALIEAYRDELRQLAKRHRLIAVDGAEIFAKSGASNADFYDQVHPSTSGHKRLGEALAQALMGGNKN